MATTGIFSLDQTQKWVDRELLDRIPPGHGVAKLKVTLPDGQVQFMVAAKLNDHWTIDGKALWKIGTKEVGASLEVLGSW